MTAVSWPASTFELDAGLGLTVCVAHQGEHVFYEGGCAAFGRGRQPKTLRVRLTRQDRPSETVPEPIQVQLDEAKLAAGIAVALDQLMQRRRDECRERPTSPQPPADAPPPDGDDDGLLRRYET